MRRFILPLAFVGFGFIVQQAALADHKSPFGAGWARMPNDIHNTRMDTIGDNTTFRDFVRYGNGADSVNRYLDDSDVTRGSRTSMRTSHTGRTQTYSHSRGNGGGGGRGRGR